MMMMMMIYRVQVYSNMLIALAKKEREKKKETP